MLKKLHRITQKRDFDKFFGPAFRKNRGYSANSDNVIVKSLRNNSDISRFAFVISTKVDKRATKRNLIKRRLREIIRLRLKKIKPGFDLLFIAQKGIVDKDYQDLDRQVEYLLKRMRMLE
ncbi:MAG: ribonuclease P protein component [Patescibacteria group bacterium]